MATGVYHNGPLCRGCDHPAHEYACETAEGRELPRKPGEKRQWVAVDCPCEERA